MCIRDRTERGRALQKSPPVIPDLQTADCHVAGPKTSAYLGGGSLTCPRNGRSQTQRSTPQQQIQIIRDQGNPDGRPSVKTGAQCQNLIISSAKIKFRRSVLKIAPRINTEKRTVNQSHTVQKAATARSLKKHPGGFSPVIPNTTVSALPFELIQLPEDYLRNNHFRPGEGMDHFRVVQKSVRIQDVYLRIPVHQA